MVTCAMHRAAPALLLRDGQHEVFEALAPSGAAAYRVINRARALLIAAEGLAGRPANELVSRLDL